jgi:hypothetical protein
MRVVPSGGLCECEACGTLCSGRFSGCASVVSMPGYVPAGAPTTFSVAEPQRGPERAPEPDPAPEPDLQPNGHLDEVQAEIAELRAILEEALEAMTAEAPTPLSHAQLVQLRLRLAAPRRAHQAVPPE